MELGDISRNGNVERLAECNVCVFVGRQMVGTLLPASTCCLLFFSIEIAWRDMYLYEFLCELRLMEV